MADKKYKTKIGYFILENKIREVNHMLSPHLEHMRKSIQISLAYLFRSKKKRLAIQRIEKEQKEFELLKQKKNSESQWRKKEIALELSSIEREKQEQLAKLDAEARGARMTNEK